MKLYEPKPDWAEQWWKMRCAAGYEIPKIAIVEYQLDRWFKFKSIDDHNRDFYTVERLNDG